MTTSAATRLRQHQRVTPLAGALARMGAGDPAAFVTTRAPFTGTLAMTAGAGSISHSRADTFAPTTADHAGIVRTCRQGEVRFWGLRRVENLLPTSETFASWINETAGTGVATTLTTTTETPPSGCGTCRMLVLNRGAGNTAGDYARRYAPVTLPSSNRNMRLSFWVKAAYPSDVGRDVAIKGEGAVYTVITLSASWTRVSAPGVSAAASSYVEIINRGTVTTANNVSMLLAGAQVEDVTNQTDTTAGEYVSTGVASGPVYHGANVDGVRYYATAQDGSTITGGGLLIEGAAQQLLASTDMTSGWSGTCSASNDGTMAAGLAMCKLTKTTTSNSEYRGASVSGGASLSAGWYCVRVTLLASSNSTQAEIGLYGGTSGWGSAGDGVATLISGPGTVTKSTASLVSITGLSTTTPSVLEIKRNLLVSETLLFVVYPDTYNSTTSGRANYVAVGNVEAGSMCTSRIVTSGTMLTRAADVPTLPTAGNLCAEWGAMSATITLPSLSAAGNDRFVLKMTGQSAWPMYLVDQGTSACYAVADLWGGYAAKSLGARTPGVPFKVASAWRTGDKPSATGAAATPATSATAATAVALPSTLSLGGESSSRLNGVIRDLCFYGLDLTTTQLATVTT